MHAKVHTLRPHAHLAAQGTALTSGASENLATALAGDLAVELTVDVVAAYVGHNAVSQADLPKLIRDIHTAVAGLYQPSPEAAPAVAQMPAVSIKKSVTPDYLICLEDGMKFKSLKRHVKTKFGLTMDEYRAKWGLPADYPAVAPNYSAVRSQLAKTNGLGKKTK